MAKKLTPRAEKEIVAKAWELRKRGIYTMREIADRLGVDRLWLIDAMTSTEESQDDHK